MNNPGIRTVVRGELNITENRNEEEGDRQGRCTSCRVVLNLLRLSLVLWAASRLK